MTRPVLVVHGEQDAFVPAAHARWLAEHLPSAELRVKPGEGHLSLYGRISEVHRWLVEQG